MGKSLQFKMISLASGAGTVFAHIGHNGRTLSQNDALCRV